jgi:ribosomal protection tetracycline resistance protein
MAILNIGILVHVDAGKTTLTERILYEAGVVKDIGSVDKGTTQTDTMEIERTRGITIWSAVASFQIGDLKVNLIDTPGHGDFIAEVERSLHVLDQSRTNGHACDDTPTRHLRHAVTLSGKSLSQPEGGLRHGR